MRSLIAPACLAGFLLASTPAPAAADIITYTWDDDRTGSTFFGSFVVNTDRLTGGRLTLDAITSSAFQFSRRSFGTEVAFRITGVSPGGIEIDPRTGAVLGDGGLTFGPSQAINAGGLYQVLGGRAEFDRNYNVSFPLAGGGEHAYLQDTAGPDEFLASSGHWEASVRPVPCPPAAVLALLALGGLAVRPRLR